MSTYTLPSGNASVYTASVDNPLAEVTFEYPVQRKQLENALKEALLELCKNKSMSTMNIELEERTNVL